MSKLLEIKEGQKAVYISENPAEDHPSVGTLITRKEHWLDDDESVAFTFIVDDVEEHEFFYLEDFSLVEEGK